MNSKNVVIGAIAAIVLIAIIGWYAGWFGASETSAPTATTEQPGTEDPATTEQPATN